MKKFLLIVMSLSIFINSIVNIPTASALSISNTDLPEIGKVVEGFKLVEIIENHQITGQLAIFKHEKTGATLVYNKNNDNNRTFSITFKTPCLDDTGVNHVLEHSVLGGSKKYPSQGLFFGLINQTYNTFMNAMTMYDFTTYPCSSLSEQQLLKLSDVYMDAVFNPMVLTDKRIFDREAYRYTLDSIDSNIELTGTVYNEMKGIYDLNYAHMLNLMNEMCSNSEPMHVSGGDPAHITELTYEQLISTHNTYYHPSNCMIFLYGDLNYKKFFKMFNNDYLSKYDYKEMTSTQYKKDIIDSPVQKVYEFPVSLQDESNNKDLLSYAYAVKDFSEDDKYGMLILSKILNFEDSKFKCELKKELPDAVVSVSFNYDGNAGYLEFFGQNIKRNEREKFKNTIDSIINNIIEEGIGDIDIVEGQIAEYAFYEEFPKDNTSCGVYYSNYLSSVWARNNMDDFAQELKLENIDNPYIKLREKAEENYFEDLLNTYFKNNPCNVFIITEPNPELYKREKENLESILEKFKKCLSLEELESFVKRTKEFDEWAAMQVPKSMIDKIDVVKIKDLPEEVVFYPVNDEKVGDLRVISCEASLKNVCYNSLLFTPLVNEAEDLHYMNLCNCLLGKLGTKTYEKKELQKLNSKYNPVNNFSFSIRENDNKIVPSFNIYWYNLSDNYANSIDIIKEIVMYTDFTDIDTIKDIVNKSIIDFENSLQYNLCLAFNRSLSGYDKRYLYESYTNGLEHYNFLLDIKEKLNSNPDEIVSKLENVYHRMCNRTDIMATFIGTNDNLKKYKENVTYLTNECSALGIQSLDKFEIESLSKNEAIKTNSDIQYNVMLSSWKELGMTYDAKFLPIINLISDKCLNQIIRHNIGAYGAQMTADKDFILLFSYRDPSIKETYKLYNNLPEDAAKLEVSQEDVDGYIKNAYSSVVVPKSDFMNASFSLNCYIEGISKNEILKDLKRIKSSNVKDIKIIINMLNRLVNKNSKITLGNSYTIEENKELFDNIIDINNKGNSNN